MKNKLMVGLWRYIINVPSFLWQKQVGKGKRRFEKAHGSLSEEERRVHHFVVKELPATGMPLSPDVISEKLDITADRIKVILDTLEKRMTFLYRNKTGAVTWAYPVTVEKTPHRMTFSSGEQLYAA
ncbi:MAG: hypothetical protein JRF27_04350 [Deltaproteobacteria bacterium]|nr:hypothetical protein [Deltaproteobacteria bacterium]